MGCRLAPEQPSLAEARDGVQVAELRGIDGAAVAYAAAVLEYLTAEIIELSGNACQTLTHDFDNLHYVNGRKSC